MIEPVTAYSIETRTLAELDTAVEYATLSPAETGPWLQKAFGEVATYLERKGAGPDGMPFARYHRTTDGRFEVEAGFPASTPTSGEGDVEPSDLPAGPAAVVVHIGPYEAMESAYTALDDWIQAHGYERRGDAWEVYFTDPNVDRDPSTWRTEVVQPYRPTA